MDGVVLQLCDPTFIDIPLRDTDAMSDARLWGYWRLVQYMIRSRRFRWDCAGTARNCANEPSGDAGRGVSYLGPVAIIRRGLCLFARRPLQSGRFSSSTASFDGGLRIGKVDTDQLSYICYIPQF